MLKGRPGRRQAVLYVALLTISLLLLAFSALGPDHSSCASGVGFAMAPIQNVLREGGQTVSSFFATLGEIDRLRQQNQDLHDAGQRARRRRTSRSRACASRTSS